LTRSGFSLLPLFQLLYQFDTATVDVCIGGQYGPFSLRWLGRAPEKCLTSPVVDVKSSVAGAGI